MTDTKEQGLAPARVVEGEIVSADAFNTQVAAWRREGFNVLTPAVSLSTIPKDHRIVISRVQIDPDPEHGEVYQNSQFTRQGEVALSKVGLEKIAACAGINIAKSVRTDSRTVEHVYSYYVEGWWIGFDGARVDRKANKSIDLRDGSPDLKGMGAAQIAQTRRHGEAICETKAQNRLYRQYGVKQKYAQEELRSPFIVLKLRYEPDMTNPIVAAIVTQIKMGATKLLFPAGALDLSNVNPLQLPEHARPAGPPQDVSGDDDDDKIVATQGAPAPADLQDFNDAPAAAAEPEPSDEAEQVRVEHVGQNATRTDFYITLDDKRVLHTKDLALAKTCNAAKENKTPLAVTIDRRGTTLELVEIGGGKY